MKVISGRITDIAWDSESKRIIAVGDGREKYVMLRGCAIYLNQYVDHFCKKKNPTDMAMLFSLTLDRLLGRSLVIIRL